MYIEKERKRDTGETKKRGEEERDEEADMGQVSHYFFQFQLKSVTLALHKRESEGERFGSFSRF